MFCEKSSLNFRAFVIKGKLGMGKVVNIDFINRIVKVAFEDKDPRIIAKDYEEFSFSNFREIAIMQWTKEADKYQDAIYVGDILKLDDKLYLVCFYNGAFALQDLKTGYHFEYFCNFSREERTYEIVGNIYENRNLLSLYDIGAKKCKED